MRVNRGQFQVIVAIQGATSMASLPKTKHPNPPPEPRVTEKKQPAKHYHATETDL